MNLEQIINHAIDKEVYIVQSIMKLLESNGVSYLEWRRISPILNSLIDEQVGSYSIQYLGSDISPTSSPATHPS